MKILICAIGRKENRFIREWVEYYKNIGVDNICLYDNNYDDEDNFNDVIGDYIEEGFVILNDYRNKKVCQLEAYNDCYQKFGNDYDWIGFFDCDEFLTICGKRSLKQILSLKKYAKYGIIKLNWENYSDSGLLSLDGRGVVESLTEESPNFFCEGVGCNVNQIVKSLVRGGLEGVKFNLTPHCPTQGNNLSCDIHGNEIKIVLEELNGANEVYVPEPTFDIAYIRHYPTKTVEDYCEKILRGYPDQENIFSREKFEECVNRFFDYNVYTKEKEDKIRSSMDIYLSKSPKCAIVIVLKSLDFTVNELFCLKHTIDVFRDKRSIYFVLPNSFNLEKLPQLNPPKSASFLKFDDKFFESDKAFGEILTNPNFYEKFSNTDYILLCTSSTWFFNDTIDNFTTLGVDFIAPLHLVPTNVMDYTLKTGDGRFSLRKVTTFAQFCRTYYSAIQNMLSFYPEDRIFGEFAGEALKVAKQTDCARFGLSDMPETVYNAVGNMMPMLGVSNVFENAEFYNGKVGTLPIVSIIVPVYNMEQYVSDTIASIKGQTYSNWECIIVNDGSTDNSEEKILHLIENDSRFKYIKQENAGVAAARNTAIKNSIGKYILPVDPDDMIMETYVQTAVDFMEENPDYAIFSCAFIVFGAVAPKILTYTYEGFDKLVQGNSIHNTSMFRRCDFDTVGEYDTNMEMCEEWELFIRLAHNNDKVYIDRRPLFLYRNKGEQTRNLFIPDKYNNTVLYIINKNKDILVKKDTENAE